MRVGVDLDQVSYPFPEVLAHWVHEVTGRPLDEMTSVTRWDFFKAWGYSLAEFERFFEDGVNAGFIFSEGDPVPGALPAVRALKAAGHSIHIVTDRFVGRRSQANTEEWLARHEFPHDSLTFSADKTVVRTDAFIDDRPEHVLALRKVGCAAFMLQLGRSDQADFPPEWTVSCWGDFVGQVERLAHREVIGVSGYARAGKDSVAKVLVDRRGYQRVAFADAIRDLIYKANPIVTCRRSLWRVKTLRLQEVVNDIGWDRAKVEITEVREFMQRIGVGARSVLGPDVWVEALFRRCADVETLVIPDVRFPNEVEAIRRRSGRVFRVQRPGVGPANGHITETALDGETFDAVIENDGSLIDLAVKVENLVGPASAERSSDDLVLSSVGQATEVC